MLNEKCQMLNDAFGVRGNRARPTADGPTRRRRDLAFIIWHLSLRLVAQYATSRMQILSCTSRAFHRCVISFIRIANASRCPLSVSA